jgi:hypothetical protein
MKINENIRKTNENQGKTMKIYEQLMKTNKQA